MLHLQRMEHLLLLCWLGREHKSLRTLQCPTFSLGPEAKITLSPHFLPLLLTTPLTLASCGQSLDLSRGAHTHLHNQGTYDIRQQEFQRLERGHGRRCDLQELEEDSTHTKYSCNFTLDGNIPLKALEKAFQHLPLIFLTLNWHRLRLLATESVQAADPGLRDLGHH